jgi:integrase
VIRKLDYAMRHLGRRPKNAPWLLPTREQGGTQSFHANNSTLAYTREEAEAILNFIKIKGSRKHGPTAALIVELMMITGLRISEACYLRADNINLLLRAISLDRNNNHSKGGKKRVTLPFGEEHIPFITELKSREEQNPTKHVFTNRGSLPNHVQAEIRRACRELNITPLGSHAFRKRNAQDYHEKLLGEGSSDVEARLEVSRHLGHNRLRVINESYVPPHNSSI